METRGEANNAAAMLLRKASYVRRLARRCRKESEYEQAARLFLLAVELERDAERGFGPYWDVELGRQLTLFGPGH